VNCTLGELPKGELCIPKDSSKSISFVALLVCANHELLIPKLSESTGKTCQPETERFQRYNIKSMPTYEGSGIGISGNLVKNWITK
jgi:hypothetical protein